MQNCKELRDQTATNFLADYKLCNHLSNFLLHFIVTYFTILYEVDNIRPFIFYIYEYNHICNNCKVYAK
jgi:hypothetical protein